MSIEMMPVGILPRKHRRRLKATCHCYLLVSKSLEGIEIPLSWSCLWKQHRPRCCRRALCICSSKRQSTDRKMLDATVTESIRANRLVKRKAVLPEMNMSSLKTRFCFELTIIDAFNARLVLFPPQSHKPTTSQRHDLKLAWRAHLFWRARGRTCSTLPPTHFTATMTTKLPFRS